MENALYIGLSRQIALQAQMEMTANNVANVNTTGYRGQNLLFSAYLADPKGQGPAYAMTDLRGGYTDLGPGSMQTTGAPLDVALQGPGFFAVSTPAGQRYTRNGAFTLDHGGNLITSTGDTVGGINIPVGTKEISIDEHGAVSTENGIVGQIPIVEFSNAQPLVREGNGLYRAEGNTAPTPAANTRAMQGMVEGSNVQAVTEMTKMIGILRDYQALQRMIQNEHDLERTAIQRLSGRNG